MAATVNHRPGQDPLGALRATFETVEVVEEFDLGAGHLAVARKAGGDRAAMSAADDRAARVADDN